MLLVLGNLAGVIGWLFLVYSYYKEDIDRILFVQIISSIFYCLNYLLLGATAGLLICLFELIKEIIYYKTDLDEYVFKATLIVYAIIAYYSYDGWFTLLPVLGSVIDGFALTKNKNIAVTGGIISNILWVIYDIIILSYSCAITDGILVLSNISIMIFGYSRLIKTDKFIIRKCYNLNSSISKTIINLDKKIYGEKYIWEDFYQQKIFEQNKDSLLLICFKDKILGYINYLTITEDEYNHIKSGKNFKNKYEPENIIKFHKNKGNYLLLESICIDPKYENYRLIKLIKNRINRLIKEKYRNKYHIKGIVSIAVTDFEKEVLSSCNFEKLSEYSTKEVLYELDSGAINKYYLTKDYKLKEKQKEYKIIKNENIKDELFKELVKLDKQFYKDEYLWDESYQKEIFNKNKNSIIAITKNNKLIGYINYLTISKEKYGRIKTSSEIIDNYDINDIKPFYKGKKNYITINSVVIDAKYQNGITVKLLTRALKKELIRLDSLGYKIGGISSTAVSKDGRKFLEQLKFTKYKKLLHNNYLYILEGVELKNYLTSDI